MLFSSITFLYIFLPCVIILYYLAPRLSKNYVLLAASLIFYACGEPKYVWLMIGEILAGYVFGLILGKYNKNNSNAPGKFILGASLFVNLGFLGYYKYSDFFLENFIHSTGLPVTLLGLALPIGISFYTFQIISYTIDVYRGDVPPQKNLFHLATYVSMFPQLIAGPIVRYSDVELQLKNRTHSTDKMWEGIRRFILGLSKKVLIANSLGELCDIFRSSSDPSVGFFWLYAIAFTLHIYFDFSGYSDMAIGLGKIFGFDLLENFNYPYTSRSVTEFWRRWHISLGSWFRDYVYIPLGGNRVGTIKWFRNIIIVWFLTGFWHGASWNFIIWGFLFAFFLILEKFILGASLKKAKVINHIYVLLVVIVGFVIFNAQDLHQAYTDLVSMFCLSGLITGTSIPLLSVETLYYLRSYIILFAIAIIDATPLPKYVAYKVSAHKNCSIFMPVVDIIFLFALLLINTAYLVDGSFNPFLYFRF